MMTKINWSLEHGLMNKFGPKWSKMNCGVLKITWHVGFGLRNVCCEFEKDQMKTLGFTVFTRNKRFWPPGGHKWNCRVPKMDWCLDLDPMHIWCEYEEYQLKTQVSRAPTRKTHMAP